ncbi:MAG: hypothetical protein DME44_04860 [Verrucomicrobia bacterium]|nr:MAG: hypothetical protein DME44_04860 [Verrucomicrobiota bacterium]
MKIRIRRNSYIRTSRLRVPRMRLLLFVFLLGIGAAAAENLPAQTIVVFNTAVPDSEALARFYAEKRGIAADHLVGLDCPSEEEISREQYDTTIAEPLRKMFEERQWWHIHETPDGEKRVQTLAIHFIALVRGVPLKIRPAATPYPGDTLGGGPIQSRNEASVDPIAELTAAPVLLVTRLDAPETATVRRMITDAIEAEKNGLWGRAFVDGTHETSGGKEVGDAWMRAIIDQCHKDGVPVVFDDSPAIFPDAFPMSDCALYYGWYAGNVAGPFNQPGFKFVPGAIAAHIHSYSAATLRDANSGWAGPLVSRGAAATVGNVYEPYLELTAHLDILNDRLLHGFTFAESVSMSSRVLSWMGVALGDPLYRPYLNWTQIDSKTPPKSAAGWRAYHDFAIKNSKLEPSDYRTQARVAAARTRNGIMLEDIGLMEMRDAKFSNAIAALEQARGAYSKRDDIIRCVLEECDVFRKSGKPSRALDLVRRVLRIVPESPAAQLLHKIESDLAPKSSPPAVASPY